MVYSALGMAYKALSSYWLVLMCYIVRTPLQIELHPVAFWAKTHGVTNFVESFPL